MTSKGVKEIIKFLQHDYRANITKSQYEQLIYLRGVEYYGVRTLRKVFGIAISACAYPECEYCHKPITNIDDLTIDHTVPRSRGGSDAIENLQPMHGKCNSDKGCTMPTTHPSQSASLTKPKHPKHRSVKRPPRNENICGRDIDELAQKCERVDNIYRYRISAMRRKKCK